MEELVKQLRGLKHVSNVSASHGTVPPTESRLDMKVAADVDSSRLISL